MDKTRFHKIQESFWLRLDNEQWVYKYPEVEILKFDDGSIHFYEFDQPIEAGILPLIAKNDGDFENPLYEFRQEGENILLGKTKYSDERGRPRILENTHIRLVPTILRNSQSLAMLTEKEFTGKLNGIRNHVVFNTKISIDNTPYVAHNQILGDELRLERVGAFYFLTFYLMGRRFRVIPISEITDRSIRVYGFNERNDPSTFVAI